MKNKKDMDKHIWEGWTVQDFVNDLEPLFDLFKEDFKTRKEIKEWCMSNQPYYKKYIKEVVDYFCSKANIK